MDSAKCVVNGHKVIGNRIIIIIIIIIITDQVKIKRGIFQGD